MLPTLEDLQSAATLVHSVMPATPQYCWPLLCERLGTQIWLKHENHTPVGAFKMRGGLTYFADLVRQGGVTKVVTATRGNHGQSVALSAARTGIEATIVVPLGNSVEKNAAMRALGARLIEHGEDFQAAREYAQSLADTTGAHAIPAFHPALLRGVGTYALELFQAVSDLDTVYVPIGMGSGICATAAVRNLLSPATRIVGVVSTHAPAYALSFAARQRIEADVTTRIADGMACRSPQPEALEIIWQQVDHIVQVTDAEVAVAMRAIYECTHNCAEGAGAAAFAAAMQERAQLPGRKVAAILSGGNVDRAMIASILAGRTDNGI